MVTFADLIKPLDRAVIVTRILSVLAVAGFPVTAWSSTSIPRILIEAFAEVLVELSLVIVAIAKMATLWTAEGDGLTLHAADAYDETRKPATVTKGTRTLVESAGTPRTWSADELVIVAASDPTLIYRNTAPVTLAAFGSQPVEFYAESPGAKYVVDASEVAELATPVPGVAIAATTGTGWITQEGTDEEADLALQTRCAVKWGSLAAAGPDAAYRFWALKSDTSITKVRVQEDPYAVAGTPSVRVYLASAAGVPTGAAVTAANAYIQARRPLGTLVSVEAAIAAPLDLRGMVYVKTAYRAAAQTAVPAALHEFFAGVDIGEGVSISQLIEVVMAVEGVTNFVPKNPAGANLVPGTDDLSPALNAIPMLVSAGLLDWTNV